MSENNHELDMEREDIVQLVDEDGNEVDFEHLMTLEHNGKAYICLVPVEPMDDVAEDELVILRIETDEDGMRTLRGDVDGNGLSVSDATLIQQYLAEFDIDIPIGETVTITEPSTESTGQTFTTDPYELPFAPC